MEPDTTSHVILPTAPERFSPLRPLGSAARSWLAEDKMTGGMVWVRQLSPAQLADSALVGDLVAAQSRLAAWRHEGFGRVPDEFSDAIAYAGIVVELPRGRLFSEWVAETGRLDWQALQPVAESIARLLEFAGEHGLADGRLTPDRVWVCNDGSVIIPEFGFGSLLDSDLREFRRASPADVAFWSPQVVDGAVADPADDLYGFGCILYYGFTGRAPFGGENLIQQIRYNQAPSPAAVAPDLAAGLAVAVGRCLEKDPSRRPATVGDALKGLMSVGKIPGPAKGKPFLIAEYDPAMADSKLPSAVADGRQSGQSKQPSAPPTVVVASGRQSALMMTTLLVSVLAVGVAVILLLLPKQQEGQRQKEMDAVRLKQLELEARLSAQQRAAASDRSANRTSDSIQNTLDEIRRSAETPPSAATDQEEKSAAARRQAADEADRLMQEISRKAAQQADRELKVIGDKRALDSTAALLEAEASFKSIFDGKTLSGWRGLTNYWSVRDGFITGFVPQDAPKSTNLYLILNDAPVGDFELRGQFRFRVLRNNYTANSGLVYRGATNNSGVVFRSYQFEIALDTNKVGALYVAGNKRGFYMLQGSGLEITADAAQSDLVDTNAVGAEVLAGRASFKREEWNDFSVLANGRRMEHRLNGHEMLSVTDNNPSKSLKGGSIALELFTGPRPGALIQFRELKLRKIEPASAGPSSPKR